MDKHIMTPGEVYRLVPNRGKDIVRDIEIEFNKQIKSFEGKIVPSIQPLYRYDLIQVMHVDFKTVSETTEPIFLEFKWNSFSVFQDPSYESPKLIFYVDNSVIICAVTYMPIYKAVMFQSACKVFKSLPVVKMVNADNRTDHFRLLVSNFQLAPDYEFANMWIDSMTDEEVLLLMDWLSTDTAIDNLYKKIFGCDVIEQRIFVLNKIKERNIEYNDDLEI